MLGQWLIVEFNVLDVCALARSIWAYTSRSPDAVEWFAAGMDSV
jgi:hypothetical protein